ncbi:1,4-alpha-glucan branching enzyme, partial [bacterium]|nr:1,4-alpha-glucan branching enzyme [bacterium]
MLLAGRLHDPFAFLGLHQEHGKFVYRLYAPHAQNVQLQTSDDWQTLDAAHGLFTWQGDKQPPRPCKIRIDDGSGMREIHDPYSFLPVLTDHDLYLFGQGRLLEAYRALGSHTMNIEGVNGTLFAVWAPNAERVSVVGDFNRWDGRCHPMRSRGSSGVWELFIPEISSGSLYKYEIRNAESGHILVKTDPYAQEFELRPGTASKVS